MHHMTTTTTGVTHQVYAQLRRATGRNAVDPGRGGQRDPERDRGAVSLEQVLWFVAAGVSVAVIAAILWGQIRDSADDPITPPQSP